jgi:N-acetylneuraminic acid mutarotase
LRREWWIIAAVTAAVACGTSGGSKAGSGQDAGTTDTGGPPGGGDSGTQGPIPDGGLIPGPDGGLPGDGVPDGGVSDFKTISWSRLTDRPLGTSEAAGDVAGGKLYTFGGFDWSKACCTPWRYAFVFDPSSGDGGTWTRLADMVEGVSHAGTTTDGTDLYWAGGFVEDASRTFQIFGTKHVWAYRVARNTYQAMPDLPDDRGAGALVYLDGKLHFFGGESFGQGHDTPDHWVLDLAGGATSWVSAAPMLPGRARNHLGSAVLDGKIYAIGGQHGHDEGLVESAQTDVYDPATDTWTPLADMPLAKGHIAAATFVFQGRIFALAGEISNGVYTAEDAAYDPVTNTWVELTPFPVAIFSGIARPMLNGFVFTTGSYSAATWLGMPAD